MDDFYDAVVKRHLLKDWVGIGTFALIEFDG